MSFLQNFYDSQKGKTNTNWIHLTSVEQLDEIEKLSMNQAVVIFKHSTTCGISAAAKARLEAVPFSHDKGLFYYLDLLTYRPVSNMVAEKFGVVHQSPQIIVMKNGKAVQNNSHHAINGDLVNKWVEN
jgi:bacillithiol system protein YtxJ